MTRSQSPEGVEIGDRRSAMGAGILNRESRKQKAEMDYGTTGQQTTRLQERRFSDLPVAEKLDPIPHVLALRVGQRPNNSDSSGNVAYFRGFEVARTQSHPKPP